MIRFFKSLPMGDKYMFATVFATLLVWWVFSGRKRVLNNG